MKKLIKHIEVTGVLRAVTGLRIGAGGSSLEIGGLDNPILRHPATRVPYVPGSSLKGKLRSLLENDKSLPFGTRKPEPVEKHNRDGKLLGHSPCECGECVVCVLFGCGKPEKAIEPSRLIFRDCPLLGKEIEQQTRLLEEGIFYSEVKAEVVMTREGKVATWTGPRSMDRIMAGTGLDFRLTVRVLEGDDESQMKAALLHAFRLLQREGLGGSVTRGYGQVRFEGLKWDGADLSAELDRQPARA